MTWLVAVLLVFAASDATAPELAQALQKKYDGVKDFSADFTHVYEGGVLKKQITERGRHDHQEAGQDALAITRLPRRSCSSPMGADQPPGTSRRHKTGDRGYCPARG